MQSFIYIRKAYETELQIQFKYWSLQYVFTCDNQESLHDILVIRLISRGDNYINISGVSETIINVSSISTQQENQEHVETIMCFIFRLFERV